MAGMSTELLSDLMRRSSGLSLPEKRRLARFLTEETPVNAANPSVATQMRFNVPEIHSQKREQNHAWLKAHREEFGGQYVALDGDRLVGSGETIKEAAIAAKENGCFQPFLVYFPRPNGEYWGGW